MKQGEVSIFIDDEQFYKLGKDVSISILNLQNDFRKHCLKIKSFYGSMNSVTNNISNEEKQYNKERLFKLKNHIPKRNKLTRYLSDIIKNFFEE